MVRRTQQREAILKAFHTAGRPLSIPELHELGKNFAPRLGLRTVYRIVHEMVENRAVLGVSYPGQPLRYDLPRGVHCVHLICRDCQQVFALDHETPEVSYPNREGFEIDGHEVILYGRCRDPHCPARRGTETAADES